MLVQFDIPDDIYTFMESGKYKNRNDLIENFQISETMARIYAHIMLKSKRLTKNATPGKDSISFDCQEDKAHLEVNSLTIHTLEQALEVANVDLDKWTVERWICNSWQVTMKLRSEAGEDKNGDPIMEDEPVTRTNYQVKVWLRPKVVQPLDVALKKFAESLPKFQFERVPKFSASSDIAGEIALLDAHFGKLAWARETGRRDYDLDIATKDYIYACEQNLSRISMYKPEKIFYIVGQDLMHVENFSGVTPKAGHVLDTDSRLPKIFEKAIETTVKCIYRCRDVAPVEVLWIPGNHDLHASMFLSVGLKHHFKDDKFVDVDVSPCQRKARAWGKLLVGWTHELPAGRTSTWTNELAQAFPDLWGPSEFREWHYGHKHKKSEIKSHPVLTQGGVLLRQLTALSPIDAWHFEHAFTDAVPGGEAFVWSKEFGVIANYVAWSKTKNISKERT